MAKISGLTQTHQAIELMLKLLHLCKWSSVRNSKMEARIPQTLNTDSCVVRSTPLKTIKNPICEGVEATSSVDYLHQNRVPSVPRWYDDHSEQCAP